MHGDLELLLERRVLDHPRLPVRELGLSPGVIGLVLSLGAVGSLVAAFTATRISDRFGIGPTTIAVATLFGPTMLLIAFAPVGNAGDARSS